MADPGDPPKKGNPRIEVLTRGHGSTYYLARRYFNLSPSEWDALPWWESVILIQGLQEQGVIQDPDAPPKEAGAGSSNPGTPPLVDYAEGLVPTGFKTRRAG